MGCPRVAQQSEEERLFAALQSVGNLLIEGRRIIAALQEIFVCGGVH